MFNPSRPANVSPGETAVDSAYASSLSPSGDSRGDMVHVENNNDDRNLAMNQKTGEVLDEDTGEVVTTTTTTTTTTTITTKNGKKINQVHVTTNPPEPHRQQQPSVAEVPGDNHYLAPSDASASAPSEPSHSPISQFSPSVPPQVPSSRPYNEPTIPTRNPNRKSREYLPSQDEVQYSQQHYYDQPTSPAGGRVTSSSNINNNFSYPSRRSNEALHNRTSSADENAVPTRPSTGARGAFENLKAAAVGIHGVGETLRGTVNSSFDSRSHDPAVRAKNQAVLDKGRAEMATMSHRNGLGPRVTHDERLGSTQTRQSESIYPDHDPMHPQNTSNYTSQPGATTTPSSPPYGHASGTNGSLGHSQVGGVSNGTTSPPPASAGKKGGFRNMLKRGLA